MGDVADRIVNALTAALAPEQLTVTDESDRHAGHAGARPGGETHFHVDIVASAFEGQGRLQRQRAINSALRDELAGPVHALSLRSRAPSEV